MNNLKKITITYIDNTYSDTGVEVLEDIVQFNFFGVVAIFEPQDGKTFIVRDLTKILNYVIKQQPFVKAKKTK